MSNRLRGLMSALAEQTDVETVELDQRTLMRLVEIVGREVLGVSSYDELQTLYHAHKVPDVVGSAYLVSLLELAA